MKMLLVYGNTVERDASKHGEPVVSVKRSYQFATSVVRE